jgi:TPR repeat protein
MPLVDEVKRPRVMAGSLLEFDEREFASSLPEDRQRLTKALAAFYAKRFDDMLDSLVGASSADPNVNYMRAVGVVWQSTETERYRIAQELLRAAASAGHQRAATLIGIALVTGLPGVSKSVEEGRELIEAAAARGDRIAQRSAGIGYLNGEFVTIDTAKGVAFLKQAVEAGDTSAMLHYAYLLSTGTGVEKNESLAEQYVKRAADAGLTAAQETLGLWIIERYKAGLIQDPSEGVRRLETAYKSGHSIYALYQLSLFYMTGGRGTWKSPEKAVALLNLCMPYAHSGCQFTYGYCLRLGLGMRKDVAKAYARYEVARLLGAQNAPKALDAMKSIVTDDEKTAALALAKSMRNELKPIPRKLGLQVPGAPGPPSPWSTR